MLLRNLYRLVRREVKDRPRMIFFHLPRTGGTALVMDVLRPNFPRRRWCHVNYDSEMRAMGGAHDPLSWPERKRSKVMLLAGHMPFGFDRHFDGESEYFTMLRDPVARAVSDYFFCRNEPSNPAHGPANALSLTEFAKGDYGFAQNCYARWLSSAAYGAQYRSQEEMLEAALKNLGSFVFAGITEYFDLSVKRICERYGLVAYPRREIHRNSATPKRTVLSDEEREVIRGYNALDLVIYERSLSRFLEGTHP